MTTIVIDLYNNQWIALLVAVLMTAGLTLLIAWPIIGSIYHRRGYEQRGREEIEPHFNIEALRRNAEALREGE